MPETDPLQPGPGDPEDRFTTLAIRYFDGVSGEAEVESLRRALCESDACCRAFVELSIQARNLGESLLHRIGQADPAAARLRDRRPNPGAGRWLLRFGAAAAIVLLIVGLISATLQSSGRHAARQGEPIAMVADVRDAVWAPGQAPLTPGERLRGGVITLTAGRVEIGFNSGALVTLVGPCEFGLNAPKRGFLRRGRLVTQVPESAKGFTVAAPGLVVVDLGTAFALDVQSDSSADLHVLSGVVEVHRDDGDHAAPRRLTAHHAMLVRGEQVRVMDHAPAPAFVSLPDPPAVEIDADPASGVVQASGLMPRGEAARVGIAGPVVTGKRQGTAAVLVFALPPLEPGTGGPTGVELEMMLTRIVRTKSGPTYGADLYLLGGRATPQPDPADYFCGSASEPPAGAVLIQRGFLTPSTPAGVVRLSNAGRAALRSKIREMYEPDGRPRHPFIVLRLNPDTPLPESGTRPKEGYEIAGIAGGPGYRPRLGIRTSDPGQDPPPSNIPQATTH